MNLLEELLESAVFQQISKKLKTPESFGIQGFQWSCWADSNRRPHPYQGCALPTELQQQMATRKGLEPSTSGVTGRRSNQLNYLAIVLLLTANEHIITFTICLVKYFLMAGAERLELSTRGFGDRCSTN